MAEHIAPFRAKLLAEGYAAESVRRKLDVLRRFDRWLARRGISVTDVSDANVEDFLRAHAEYWSRRGAPRTVRRFVSELRAAGVISSRSEQPAKGLQQGVIDNFAHHLRADRAFSERTIEQYSLRVRQFLHSTYGSGTPRLKSLSSRDFTRHLDHQLRHAGRHVAKESLAPLRSFARYLHVRGIVATNLSGSIPPVRRVERDLIPRYVDARVV